MFCRYLVLLVFFLTAGLTAQDLGGFQQTRFVERNLSGPRLGVTFIPGNGELVQKLEEKGVGRLISQFGWHFEWQIVPDRMGPSFVIETVPLIAGVEYGKFIPSVTLAMGIRLPSGYEFGMGPNVLFGGEKVVNSALVLAIGKSINYSGVSIPVNFVYATNPSGNRFSIMLGYAISE